MSDDPETLRQISELAADTRPLLVLDVDDVVLEFLTPFMGFLGSRHLELRLESFKLSGNIRRLSDGEAVEQETVRSLIGEFFERQAEWQVPAPDAAGTIAEIARSAEVVLLTAMPHKYRDIRRRLLDDLGMDYPLLTTETAKGPALRILRGATDRPIAFADDLPQNLASARAAVSDVHLYHFTLIPALRGLLPPVIDGVQPVNSWSEAGPRMMDALGLN